MHTVRAIGLILGKDLRQRLRDSSLLIYALALPLGLAFMFSTMFGDVDGGFSADYAVVDDDGGSVARVFTEDVLTGFAEADGISVKTLDSAAEARRQVADGDLEAAFLLPAGFSADVESGRNADLTVIGDVDASIAVQVARELADGFATGQKAVALAVAVGLGGQPGEGDPADPDRIEQLVARATEHASATSPIALGAEAATGRRELDTSTYFAAGMAVFFLLFVVTSGVTSIFEEMRNQTMARLLAAPVARSGVLAAKLLGGALVGAASMTVLVVASSILMDADWGPVLGVAILVAAVVLAASGLMAMIAMFTKTPEQASNAQSAIALLLGMLGGSFFPVGQLGVLGQVSYVSPHRWFLQGLTDLSVDGLSAVVVPAATLLGVAALTGGFALLKVGRMLQP